MKVFRTRSVRLAGLAFVGFVAAAALVLAAPRGTGLTVQAAENPKAVAEAWMREQSSDTLCFEAPVVDYYLGPTLQAADNLPADNSWLEPGSDWFYVGDIAQAKVDLQGASAVRNGTETWLMGTDAKGPIAIRYDQVMSPKGRSVWVKKTWERALPASACKD